MSALCAGCPSTHVVTMVIPLYEEIPTPRCCPGPFSMYLRNPGVHYYTTQAYITWGSNFV